MIPLSAPRLTRSGLEREQVQDLRRSVFCGELSWDREAVDDGWDGDAELALAVEGVKPVGTARLLHRGDEWHLELLAVLPRQRRQGRGRGLVEFLAALARRKGAVRLLAVANREA